MADSNQSAASPKQCQKCGSSFLIREDDVEETVWKCVTCSKRHFTPMPEVKVQRRGEAGKPHRVVKRQPGIETRKTLPRMTVSERLRALWCNPRFRKDLAAYYKYRYGEGRFERLFGPSDPRLESIKVRFEKAGIKNPPPCEGFPHYIAEVERIERMEDAHLTIHYAVDVQTQGNPPQYKLEHGRHLRVEIDLFSIASDQQLAEEIRRHIHEARTQHAIKPRQHALPEHQNELWTRTQQSQTAGEIVEALHLHTDQDRPETRKAIIQSVRRQMNRIRDVLSAVPYPLRIS